MEIGRKIIHLDSVDSTNNYAANLLKAGQIESGTVIMADEQFAGRGQRAAVWSVNSGENLTFSFFIDNVNLSVDRQFVLTQLVSMSLLDLLAKLGLTATIKWPNDLYCGERKIAGVLIENQLHGALVKSAIVGIGLNVNQDEFKGFKATSTFIETGLQRFPKELLLSYTVSFSAAWRKYMDGHFVRLKTDYLKHLYRLNMASRFLDAEGPFSGRITDVLDSGKLVVQKGNENVYFAIKEIQFLH
ncbi:MAG: biotin--[acetyl-CoA-carboxylase] ligase [Bacteroidetes bacterium RIFCSPHIGHO2_02_FULL_44_7]|nr:MAG: biotin--[acetyl-CoA-carboxylase] ligase [Bacteroidetes bacterium RIFCSPHIGHO2_02_FULL_44_7]